MKFKLDENLSKFGHDVSTVSEQGLEASVDEELAALCLREGRVLVTLDLDFESTRVERRIRS